MDERKPHPAVTLLIARMESNPEEFTEHPLRWTTYLTQIQDFACEEDFELLNAAHNAVRMNHVHEKVIDELLNGDERRVQRERDNQTKTAQMYAQQAGLIQNAMTQNPYANTYNTLAGINPGVLTPALNIGGETLDASMIRKLKSKLGL